MKLNAQQRQNAQQLISAIDFIGQKDWCPATGGNFSIRLDDQHRLVTQSGRDKRAITMADFMVINQATQAINPSQTPSAEAALHNALYQLDPSIQCVLHTHSVNSTVLSRSIKTEQLTLQGYEMQKALSGNSSHEPSIQIAIFDNSQDIDALAEQVKSQWQKISQPGLLVRGHGLYTWGASVAQAKRHLEGLEFLFACHWQEMLLNHP